MTTHMTTSTRYLGSRVRTTYHERYVEVRGTVDTAGGIVDVWCLYSSNGDVVTMLRFICGGVMHRRQYSKRFKHRYLVTLARRFAQEMQNPRP